jgi:hypothetical protein
VNTRSLSLPVLTSLPTAIEFHAFGVMMARKKKNIFDDLSNFVRPFDYMVKVEIRG